MARRETCEAEGCTDAAAHGHYLCTPCWRKLPYWLCRAISEARVAGRTNRADGLRTIALRQLRDTGTAVYARISAQMGERDAVDRP